MCFEWDERYRREQEAARLSKQQVDELVKRSEAAVQADLPESGPNQPANRQEEETVA